MWELELCGEDCGELGGARERGGHTLTLNSSEISMLLLVRKLSKIEIIGMGIQVGESWRRSGYPKDEGT